MHLECEYIKSSFGRLQQKAEKVTGRRPAFDNSSLTLFVILISLFKVHAEMAIHCSAEEKTEEQCRKVNGILNVLD